MQFEQDKDPALRQDYLRRVQVTTPDSPLAAHMAKAFLTGGILCLIAQLILHFLISRMGWDRENAGSITTIVMIGIGVLATGLGVYDKIYAFGGGGAALPVTGFANSVASPAMEFKKEGWITGTGAKIFSLAGPVLVYGISASVLVGVMYLLLEGVMG